MAGIYDERILGAKQQAETARKLREGIQTPEGQMVSGHFVAPSITQYLGNALRSYQSGSQERAALEQAQKLEQQKQQEIAAIQGQLGPQAQPVVGEAGPQLPTRQPTEQERMAALLRGQSVAPEVFQPQVQMEQWQQGQQAKQEAQQAALEDRKAQREWQAGQDRQAREERFLQQKEMVRLAAGLRQPTQAQIIQTAEGPMQMVGGRAQPIIGASGQPVRAAAGAEKPLTEFQGKSTSFGSRAAQSHNILNTLEENVSPTAVSASHTGGMAVNWALPAEVQRTAQAQRDFVNAVLRQESGAAIGASEFDNARKQYFPQPGDTPQVIQQKRANREMVIKGFTRQAGPGGADINEVLSAGAPTIGAKPSAQGGAKFLGFE